MKLKLDSHAWLMHDLCMATKTISLETDAYELLLREKRCSGYLELWIKGEAAC